LIFDLNPKGYFVSGETKSDTVDCNAD